MKRLGTTPKRRPTVACQPTIGHRTPKNPRRTHDDITILLPFEYSPCGGYELDFRGWNMAVPQAYRTSNKETLEARDIINTLIKVAPAHWFDVRVARKENRREFVITAKKPITITTPDEI